MLLLSRNGFTQSTDSTIVYHWASVTGGPRYGQVCSFFAGWSVKFLALLFRFLGKLTFFSKVELSSLDLWNGLRLFIWSECHYSLLVSTSP